MRNPGSDFVAFADLDGVYVAKRGKLQCMAIQLSDGTFCLYSPVLGLSAGAYAKLTDLGVVSLIFAPNHYHNRGLGEAVEAFPNARLICSEAARPRLSKVTGLRFGGMEPLEAALPTSVQISEPDGLKTGEVWLEVERSEGASADLAWIVVDAFSSSAAKAGKPGNAPSLLATFPRYGVGSPKTYAAWVKTRIAARPPSILIPCHGEPVTRTDLGALLSGLVDDLT